MNFNLYKDVKAFYKDTYSTLMERETQNGILLGNVIIGYEGKDKADWRDPANWFMATITDEKSILLVALMTPPHNLTLYAAGNQFDDEILTCLAKGIMEADIKLGGVMTESTLAKAFARVYSKLANVDFEIFQNMRIHELVTVNPDIPQLGTLRPPKESDIAFFPYWQEGFQSDCFGTALTICSDIEKYNHYLTKRKLYILEDNGTPVSMAMISRELQSVGHVALVYTPPYFRGRGYASSCVAKISQLILDSGFSKCVLYTDLANPTSNKIYQKIGYQPICDSLSIRFKW